MGRGEILPSRRKATGRVLTPRPARGRSGRADGDMLPLKRKVKEIMTTEEPPQKASPDLDAFIGDIRGRVIPTADEAGAVWTLRVEPKQDIAFWLTGDVLPYLSTSPERVLVRADDR